MSYGFYDSLREPSDQGMYSFPNKCASKLLLAVKLRMHEFFVCCKFKLRPIPFKLRDKIAWQTNNLDSDETPGTSASNPDPNCLKINYGH